MTTSQTTDEPRSMWRRVAAWVLVVLMGIAVAGSVVGFWVNRTVLETDRFMAVVTPIVESDSVQAVVSDRSPISCSRRWTSIRALPSGCRRLTTVCANGSARRSTCPM